MTKAQIRAMHAKKGQTARGIAQDKRKTAKNTLPATKANIAKWEKAPRRIDIIGKDTRISKYKPPSSGYESPYRDLTHIWDGVWKGKNVTKQTAKDAERLYEAINRGDTVTVNTIEKRYRSAHRASKKRGQTRDRYIAVDGAKVRVYNLALLAQQKMK